MEYFAGSAERNLKEWKGLGAGDVENDISGCGPNLARLYLRPRFFFLIENGQYDRAVVEVGPDPNIFELRAMI